MNKKLKKLATTLKEMGEKEASHKVLSMLDDALPIKGAGSKKEETDENKGGELSPLEKLHKLIKEGPKARPKPEETESSKPEETESSKSEKTRPKSNKKKSSLKVGSKDKRRVRRLQKALMKAGFDLPRFGADGLFGRETKSAVIKFKKKAAADGRYSGEFDEIERCCVIFLLEVDRCHDRIDRCGYLGVLSEIRQRMAHRFQGQVRLSTM